MHAKNILTRYKNTESRLCMDWQVLENFLALNFGFITFLISSTNTPCICLLFRLPIRLSSLNISSVILYYRAPDLNRSRLNLYNVYNFTLFMDTTSTLDHYHFQKSQNSTYPKQGGYAIYFKQTKNRKSKTQTKKVSTTFVEKESMTQSPPFMIWKH